MSNGRSNLARVSFALLVLGGLALPLGAAEHVRVRFDIPDKIECNDVTPAKCAVAHPTLKVIEAKFRISASFVEGSEADILDFDYMISSPGMRLKILDYLPNTTLESNYANDRIEVADSTESTTTTSEEAKVGYKVLSLGTSASQNAKKSEQNHYQRIAPKSVVLASGTLGRGHGVFYKLRPSKEASLEGAKEFSILVIVPKTWQGDWCTFACVARAKKKSLISTSVVMAGIECAHVGMYLCGNHDGSELSARLCELQERNDGVLARQLAKEAAKAVEAMHATTSHHFESLEAVVAPLTHWSSQGSKDRQQLEHARQEIMDVEGKLEQLSGVVSVASSAEPR